MATIEKPSAASIAPDRVLLRGASWERYEQLREIRDNWGVRMTYSQGNLELMSASIGQEDFAQWLGRMLEAFTEELNLPIRGLGAATWKTPNREFGLEADRCYYIQNEARVRHLKQIDLTRDPPPDIAIEVEVSRAAIGKLPLYATLGVPEVWRCKGGAVEMLLLSDAAEYVVSERSQNVPLLESAALNPFLQLRDATDETTWIRSFRAWVRQTFLAGEG